MKGFSLKSHTDVFLANVCSFFSPVIRANAGPGREHWGPGLFPPLRTTGRGDVLQIRGAGCSGVFWLLQTEIELQYPCPLDLGSLTALPRPPCLQSEDCQTDLSIGPECSLEEGFVRGRAPGLISPAEPIILQQLFMVNCSPYLQPEPEPFLVPVDLR